MVIPIFNEENIIETFLNQFLDQDLPVEHYTIFLVNNNSTDSTFAIVESFFKKHSQIKYKVIFEKIPGIPAARKAGFDAAKDLNFDIILSFDSDTLFPNKILSYVRDEFEKNKLDYLIGDQIFPLQTVLEMVLTIPELLKYDKFFYLFEEKYFGERFFGPYSAVLTSFYKRIPYEINNELVPYEDVLLSRRCYYCQGKYKKSTIRVITSDRRIVSNIEAWLTRERIPTEKINKGLKSSSNSEIFKLTKKQTISIKKKRLEVGIRTFVNVFVDALFFIHQHPNFSKKPLEIVTRVAQEVFEDDLRKFQELVAQNGNDLLFVRDKILQSTRKILQKKLEASFNL